MKFFQMLEKDIRLLSAEIYRLIKIPYASGKPENIVTFDNKFSASGLYKIEGFGFLVLFKNNQNKYRL